MSTTTGQWSRDIPQASGYYWVAPEPLEVVYYDHDNGHAVASAETDVFDPKTMPHLWWWSESVEVPPWG